MDSQNASLDAAARSVADPAPALTRRRANPYRARQGEYEMATKMRTMREILARGPVMPILTVADASLAGDLARALVAGGVFTFEVVLRTPGALDALKAMAAAAPEASIGIGTLLTAADVSRAQDAGAAFGVSPGLTRDLAQAVRGCGLPFIPGVATASEVMRAREFGFREMKLFPANVAGGVSWLQAMGPVFPDVAFCPTGGIKPADIPAFLAEPNCAAVGGSWVAPKDRLAAKDWAGIEKLARQAAAFGRG
jgi:2-dehydro-3-deoxyphosphogluconate aldolase/(4S)-4-hydroxy-2-oxoglutarate aldolase